MVHPGGYANPSGKLAVELILKTMHPPRAPAASHLAGTPFVVVVSRVMVALRSYGVHVLTLSIFDKAGTAGQGARISS